MDTTALHGPISEGRAGLVDLTEDEVVKCLAAVCEAILLGQTAVIHINGPALSIVTLVRWMGKAVLGEFLDAGLIRFVFTPMRSFTYSNGKMCAAIAVSDAEGIGYLLDPFKSIEYCLRHQLNMSQGAAQRFADRVLLHTQTTQPVTDESLVPGLLDQASKILSVSKSQFYGMSNSDPLVLPLLNLAEQASKMELGLQVGVKNFLHTPPSWYFPRKLEETPTLSQKFKWLLTHEHFPDIETLIRTKEAGAWLLALRQDSRFPYWLELLRDLPSSEANAVAEYFRVGRELALKRWSERLPTKILRLAAGLVLAPLIGAASPIYSVYDSVGSASRKIDGLQQKVDPKAGIGTFLVEHRIGT